MYSCDGIYHPLGDIYRMVADPLIILGRHQKIQGNFGIDVLRIDQINEAPF